MYVYNDFDSRTRWKSYVSGWSGVGACSSHPSSYEAEAGRSLSSKLSWSVPSATTALSLSLPFKEKKSNWDVSYSSGFMTLVALQDAVDNN